MHFLRSPGSGGAPLFLIGILALAGCAANDLPIDAAPEEILERAEGKLAAEKYYDAAELLEHFIRRYPGTAQIPRAKLRLGDARFGLGEYVLARGEYEDVVEDYPSSPYVEEARFKIARCAYAAVYPHDRDQSETEEAIRLLEEFREEYPGSRYLPQVEKALADCRDRLARGDYEAGRFYEKRKRLRAAKIEYEYVLREFPETVWAKRACFRLGEIYRIRGKLERAAEFYRRLVEDWPASEEAKRAEAILSQMSTGGRP
jgi:outer membrane protein assembly factor BamD